MIIETEKEKLQKCNASKKTISYVTKSNQMLNSIMFMGLEW